MTEDILDGVIMDISKASIDDILGSQYSILGHMSVFGITEVRDILNGQSYWAKSKAEFIAAAKPLLERDIYVGINPRRTNSGKDDAVSHISCLVVDIDPVRPKGEGSTVEQHELSCKIGEGIAKDIGGMAISSGSGCHVYFPIYPIKVENKDEIKKSSKRWLDAIRSKYESKEIRIDPIFDLSRVIRIWGSFNTKSRRFCGPTGEFVLPNRHKVEFNQKPDEPKKAVLDDPIQRRFSLLYAVNKKLKEICDGDIEYPSRSESDNAFTRILCRAHFTPEEIFQLRNNNRSGSKDEWEIEDSRRICLKELNEPLEKTNSYSLINHGKKYYTSLKNRSMGILTGISILDEMVSGIKPGKLYIFAARPNEGKTSLITQILTNIAEQGKTCLFYPTEVGAEPIFDKILSRKTRLSLKKFQNGSFLEEDYVKIESVKSRIADLPLIVVEDFSVTPDTIEEGIKKYAPDIVALDYFQVMSWKDPSNVGEKDQAVKKLKEIAKNYDIPIIVASQLNRSVDGKSDLRQLKGVGTLEELGDVITFITTKNRLVYPRTVELDVKKSKYSQTGVLSLDFFCSTCEFTPHQEL